ncbi:MAG: serine hydrolase, partial [Gemmatimonadaceae bacterium]|nr:serine hydrolase [Gemmatimonadaceae bacterium]
MLLPILALLCTLGMPCPLPSRAPDSVGMSAARLAAVDRVVERGVQAAGFPGAAVIIGRRDATVLSRGYGTLDWSPGSAAVSPERTIYDLASLTKVVATTAAVMVLYDEHRIDLDAPVARYLPAFARGAKARVTIRELLEHRSGLPAGSDLSHRARSPARARALVLATALAHEPGTIECYSDVGMDVLGFVVEAVAHEPLDRFVHRRIFAPLAMTSTTYRPGAALRARAAPTERHSSRGHTLKGEVHDGDAYALGGVAGHAGLFSTASDLARFAQMLLDGGTLDGTRIIADSTVALFTHRADGWRALGWDTCAGGASCGQHMSERAYGHTGFTGTSLWIDPDRGLYVIVLANWLHERPDGLTPPIAILADVRADVADIAT